MTLDRRIPTGILCRACGCVAELEVVRRILTPEAAALLQHPPEEPMDLPVFPPRGWQHDAFDHATGRTMPFREASERRRAGDDIEAVWLCPACRTVDP